MKNFLLLIIFFFLFNQKTLAQIILVPEKNIDSIDYLKQCKKNGYTCSHEFMIEKTKAFESLQYNTLIENLDLVSDVSRKKLPDDLQLILKKEMISIEQLETLIQISEKAISLEENKKTEFLKKEMTHLLKILENTTESETETVTYIVFKKRLSEHQFLELKNQIQNFQFYKIDPYSFTDKNFKTIEFLSGNCEHYQIAPMLTESSKGSQLIPIFKDECSFGSEVSKSMGSVNHFLTEYKSPLIWTSLMLGTLLFLKNYSVEFK